MSDRGCQNNTRKGLTGVPPGSASSRRSEPSSVPAANKPINAGNGANKPIDAGVGANEPSNAGTPQ